MTYLRIIYHKHIPPSYFDDHCILVHSFVLPSQSHSIHTCASSLSSTSIQVLQQFSCLIFTARMSQLFMRFIQTHHNNLLLLNRSYCRNIFLSTFSFEISTPHTALLRTNSNIKSNNKAVFLQTPTHL